MAHTPTRLVRTKILGTPLPRTTPQNMQAFQKRMQLATKAGFEKDTKSRQGSLIAAQTRYRGNHAKHQKNPDRSS